MKTPRDLKGEIKQKQATPLGIWTLAQVALEISKLPGGAEEFEQNLEAAFNILQKYEKKLKSENLVNNEDSSIDR